MESIEWQTDAPHQKNRCCSHVPGYNERMSQTEIIFAVQESPEGGFEAKALSHSIYTEAETLDELKKKVRDAVRCHFEENERPSVIRLHLVKDEVISA